MNRPQYVQTDASATQTIKVDGFTLTNTAEKTIIISGPSPYTTIITSTEN
jgi:hypothetical protein